MSAPPQQRKKAHKQTVARDLRGDLARESPAISSPASQASAASLASGAGMAAATIPSPPPNTAVTCTRLPHRGYIPPHAITGPSPETSSQPGSLNHGPSAGESSTYQARPYVPFRANHPDRVHVGPWWGGNLNPPYTRPLPYNPDIGRGRNPYPSYAAPTESSARHSRQPPGPSWGGGHRRPRNNDRDAGAGGRGGPNRLSHYVPPELRVGYLAVESADDVIARLLKPHPKLLAQAAAKAARQEKFAPQLRAVDSYRPAPRTRSEPQRLNDRALYSTWSKEKLLREADIRRLSYEHKDPGYLAEILLVNDRKFYEKREEYQLLRIKELLEEAEVETVSLTCDRYWDHDRLVSELVENVARVAVTRHNDLLRAEQVARRQAAQARVSVYTNRPSRSPRILKTTNNSQKVNDLALKKWNGSTSTASTGTQPAAEEKKPRHTQRKAGSSREKAEDRSSVTREVETSKDESSQQNDSGYFSSHNNSPTSLSASTSSPTGDGDGDEDAMPINHSKKRLNARRNSKQDTSKPVANKLREKHVNSEKRARPSEDKEEPEEKPSKKAKTSSDKTPRKRATCTIVDDDKLPSKSAKQNIKRKASEELTPESDDSASISDSGNDRPKKKIAGKRSNKVQKTTKEPKKLRGITTAERIPGMVYKEYTDGSWGLVRSAGARRGYKAAAERRYNYIK
jgi:hypothetical protein